MMAQCEYTLLNYTLKDGQDDHFYVMCLLPRFFLKKMVTAQGWADRWPGLAKGLVAGGPLWRQHASPVIFGDHQWSLAGGSEGRRDRNRAPALGQAVCAP